ncbi:hypothetical protein ACIBKX_34100 [Streptomyces sp. NPDC050658]|uniref:hypothetical protein n=1 Tax=unclassified Streptomyces TaxID=2593676 RepID=UPI00341BA693
MAVPLGGDRCGFANGIVPWSATGEGPSTPASVLPVEITGRMIRERSFGGG